MIIEYFLFCLSFPLCFCTCSKQKRTAPTVLGSDRVCNFLFCLVRARHFFASGRQQILDDYFLFRQMSQTKRITVNENIRVSNSVIGITSLVPYQFREERFSSYPHYITHRNFCNSIYWIIALKNVIGKYDTQHIDNLLLIALFF